MSWSKRLGSIFPDSADREHKKRLLLALSDVRRHIEQGHYSLAEQGMDHVRREIWRFRWGEEPR